jgi:hypothetical protein
MDSEPSLREFGAIGMRPNDTVELPGSSTKREKDAINQLRNEFKAAVKDLRNDVSPAKSISNLLLKVFFSNFQMRLLAKQK